MTSPIPSNRSFANVFTVFFALLALLAWWNAGHYVPFLVLSVGVFSVGRLAPHWLTPLNRAWMRIGDLLNRIVSPIVLGIMYFILITPFGLIMRAFAKYDPMKRRFNQATMSYWVKRTPPGPAPQSFPDQF